MMCFITCFILAELYWEDAMRKAMENSTRADGRIQVTIQEEDKHGGWGNVYTYVTSPCLDQHSQTEDWPHVSRGFLRRRGKN